MSLSERLRRLDDRAITYIKVAYYRFQNWFWASKIGIICSIPRAAIEATRGMKRIAIVAEREGLRVATLLENFPAHVDKWDAFNMGPEDVLAMWERMGVQATNQLHRILTDPGLEPQEVARRVLAIVPQGTKVEVTQAA